MNDGYDTLIITFSEPIEVLDGMFEDIDTWGVDNLKKWVDDYESTRFTRLLVRAERFVIEPEDFARQRVEVVE